MKIKPMSAAQMVSGKNLSDVFILTCYYIVLLFQSSEDHCKSSNCGRNWHQFILRYRVHTTTTTSLGYLSRHGCIGAVIFVVCFILGMYFRRKY